MTMKRLTRILRPRPAKTYPAPTAIPMDAETQMIAAVVAPLTRRRPCRMTPAPRKPIPVTICAATRPESPVVLVKANESIVKTAAPRQTRAIVRMPAGFSRRCRSPPMSMPHAMAAKARTGSTQGDDTCASQLPHNQE